MITRFFNVFVTAVLCALIIYMHFMGGATKPIVFIPAAAILFFLFFLRAIFISGMRQYSEKPFMPSFNDVLAAALIFLAVISLEFSVNKFVSFYSFLVLVMYIFVFYTVIGVYTARRRDAILLAAVIAGVCTAIYGYYQYAGLAANKWKDISEYISATYRNHSHYSGYLELIIPVAMGFLIKYKGKKFGLTALISIVILILVSVWVLAQSRGSWVSLSISMTAMFFIVVKRRAQKVGVLAGGLLFFLILAGFLFHERDNIAARFDKLTALALEDNMFTDARARNMDSTYRMIMARPGIGYGIGAFDWGYYRYRPKEIQSFARFAHNDYLQIASEMGIAALVCVLFIFFGILKKGFSMARDPVILGISVAALAFMIHGLFDFNFHIPANMFLFVIYMGLIAGEYRIISINKNDVNT